MTALEAVEPLKRSHAVGLVRINSSSRASLDIARGEGMGSDDALREVASNQTVLDMLSVLNSHDCTDIAIYPQASEHQHTELACAEIITGILSSDFAGRIFVLAPDSSAFTDMLRYRANDEVHRIHVIDPPKDWKAIESYLKQNNSKNKLETTRVALLESGVGSVLAESTMESYYQPLVDPKDGSLARVESLIRWIHPTLGPISPSQLPDCIEKTRALDAVFYFALQHALHSLNLWHASGMNIEVSVNVSLNNLSAKDFGSSISRIFRQHQIEPARIVFEITETGGSLSQESSLFNLLALRLRGSLLSMDDFGSGDSNLRRLSAAPFSEVKMDGEIVKNAASGHFRSLSLLRASLDFAKGLGLNTICEGVESLSEWRMVRDLKCDLVQGHFIGRAMRNTELNNWWLTWRERGRDLALD